MKIAIPLFQERVSPHFGSSCDLLVVEDQGNRCREVIYHIKGQTPLELAREILGLEVEMVICGGIQKYWKDWLIQKGIKVLDNQSGAARTVIQGFLAKSNPLKLKRGGRHGK